MKRLLCIINTIDAGGAETFLMKIYRNIDKTRYQFDFCINTIHKGFYEDEILNYGGKIYRIPQKSEGYYKYKEALTRVIRENDYKYVIRIASHCFGFIDLKIAKEAGAEVCAFRSSNSSDSGGLIIHFLHKVSRIFFKKYVDIMIAPSDLAAKYTFGENDYASQKVKIIHNALALSDYDFSLENRNRVRDELGIPNDSAVIGHVGRFDKQKNHKYLVDIFYEFQRQYCDTYLLLVGSGDLEQYIRDRVCDYGIENKVKFLGTRRDVSSIYSAMDFFVLPSFYEGMPNALLEAQISGLKCYAANTITESSNVSGNVDFLSIDTHAINWASSIKESLNYVRRSQVGKFISANYDIAMVSKEFINLIFD